MIRPINHNETAMIESQSTKEIIQTSPPQIATDKSNEKILDTYNLDLYANSPTYTNDIKALMKKANIEDNNLNAEIVKAMDKCEVEVTKDTLSIIKNQLGTEDLFKLYEQGYNIEELTIGIISKEIKSNEIHYVNKEENKDEVLNHTDNEIIQALVNVGIPLTDKNIETLTKYKEKLESVLEPSNITITNIIRHSLETTINNLYTAKHSGVTKDYSVDIKEEEIIAILEPNGIKATQENIKAVRALIGGNIEVNKQNVERFVDTERTLESLDVDKLIIDGAWQMKKGQKPGDIDISYNKSKQSPNLTYDEIKQVVEDIKQFDDKVIEETYAKDKPITIKNLQQTLYENVEKVLDKEKVEFQQVDKEKIVVTKRQIEELRLKLTVEAALKLNNKLDIQTADLHKVVEELKVLEKEKCENILINMQVAPTEENVEYMQTTSERLYNISKNKELAATKVVEQEAEFTLEGMDEAIKTKLAQQAYEDIGTKPERHFGESISKVENQLEHILEMNDIEVTSQTLKAAKALVQNNVDVTRENIEQAKRVLVKIETVLYELRPAVVAQLLQDGIRLDNMDVDNLIQHIRQLKKETNQDPTQKLAEAILELDKTNQLSLEEKEGLIAVYRMLNTITKNETGAIGFLLKNNTGLTLGNLFEASKYIKQVGNKTGKMDVEVDDRLGVREGEAPNNIRSLIEGAVKTSVVGENKNIQLNNKDILEHWLSRITPEELKKYIDTNKSLEEIDVQQAKLSSLDLERTTKQVGELEKVTPRTLTFLKEQNIPLTIPNIYWTNKIIKNPFLLGDMLSEYENLSNEKIKIPINSDRIQDLEDVLDLLQEELKEQIPSQLSATQNTQAYSMGKELDQMLNIQKQIANKDGIYQIPVELHHGISNLNIYVMKDKEHTSKAEKEELRAYMSIKTKNLGIIQIHMGIQDKGLSFEMIGENPEITSKLKQSSSELSKAIGDIGYNVLQAKFSQGEFKNPIADKSKEQVPFVRNKITESAFEHIV